MMCHRVSRFRVKHEKTTSFQGKMDFRNTPMCAVWNSGIEIIYAKEKIGENNYRNAYRQSKNVYELSDYLSKLVNE